jgi:hypothetical protein
VRGALFPHFPNAHPYFFLDPTKSGYGWVFAQIAQLTTEFVVLEAAVVGLDRLGTLAVARLRAAPAGG